MTLRTLGQSRPMPNVIVATTTCNLLHCEQNDDIFKFLTDAVVQAQIMSTSLKHAKSIAPIGSVK